MTIVSFLRKTLALKKPVHVYRCGKCGRVLQDADSIARGYGSDCWKLVRDQYITKEDVLDLAAEHDPLPAPGFRIDPETGELLQIDEQSSKNPVPKENEEC